MVEQVGLTGSQESAFVNNSCGVWEQVADPHTTLAMLLKGPACSQKRTPVFEGTVHEGKSLPFQVRIRNGLAVVLLKDGFVVQQFQLRRASGHEQVNDLLGFRHMVGKLGGKSIV